MDRPPQTQRSWQVLGPSQFVSDGENASEHRQIPGIATTLERRTSSATDHRLPPITTTFSTQSSRLQDNTTSAEFESRELSLIPSPLQSSATSARGEKRPRWHWSQDSAPGSRAYPDTQHYNQALERNRTREGHTIWAGPGHLHPSNLPEGPCTNCANTDELVARIVSGLIDLQGDIRHALELSRVSDVKTNIEVTRYGLTQSLLWATENIQTNSRLVRQVAAVRAGQSPLVEEVAKDTDPSGQLGNFNATAEFTDRPSKRQASCLDDRLPTYVPHNIIQGHRLGPPENLPQSFSHLPDIMKRNFHTELPPVRPAQSPRGSPPMSAFSSTHSPPHSQPSSRTLPSPTTFPYSSSTSSVPSSYGDAALSAAQTSHLQDLQHQISTKTLALQTLQREHDQLLAAFSRSQIRCSTLDKKSQVSDHEINTLSEEKARLQQQVESLEAQVEELARARDDAKQQSAANGTQWQRIMAMSSQLQIRSAEETRQYRADREAWERDRDGLQRRIQQLEAKDSNVGPRRESGPADPSSNDDILASTSLDKLREEIVRLRRSCAGMESILRDIQGETEHIGPSLATLTNVNERISALSSKTRSDTSITGPTSESDRKAGEGD